MMTIEKFQRMIAQGEPLAGTEMITFMRQQSAETRRLLMDLNTNYHTDEEIVDLFSRITATDVHPSFRMFPPFYTDFGKNIHLGKNVFINSACQFQDQGGIFIGGINGMVCINEDMAELTRPDLPTLSLGDIITGEHSVLGEVDDSKRELKCPAQQDLVNVKLLTHTTDRFRKRTYRWRIEGPVKQEMESREPQLTLRTLAAGTYHIYATCSTKDSSWMPMTHIITFNVPPAWYQTWWFILGCAFLISGNVIYWIWRSMRRKEEKMLMALNEHKRQVYEEKVRFLININHELRTPLTLIHGPLTQIMQHLSPDNTYYLPLKKVLKQTRRMKGLLDMVLSLRKMEMKETKLQFLPYPLNEWLQDTINDFQYEGQERGIRLDFQPDPAIGEVCQGDVFQSSRNVIEQTCFCRTCLVMIELFVPGKVQPKVFIGINMDMCRLTADADVPHPFVDVAVEAVRNGIVQSIPAASMYPQKAIRIFLNGINVVVRQRDGIVGIAAIDFHIVAVVAVQPRSRGKPHEPLGIFVNGIYLIVGKPVFQT